MMGLGQIRAINSWAKSEECKRLAKALNRSAGCKSEHKERPAVVAKKRGG